MPPALRAALFMIFSAAIWSGFSATVKYLGSELHGFEIAFFRVLFGTLVMAPFLFRGNVPLLPKREVMTFYLTRGGIGAVSLLAWFYSLTILPLAEATALSFTAPLFGTIAAIVILKEVVGLGRWGATIVGFLGAMIVVRPGLAGIHWGSFIAILSAAAAAINIIYMKILSRTERADHIVAYQTLFLIPFAFVAALPFWTWPTLEQYAWMAALGSAGALANWCTVKAFALGDTTAVMPFDFIRLPFVAIIGFLAFSELPDRWTWIGGAIIFASSIYIARREAQLSKRQRAAAPAETI